MIETKENSSRDRHHLFQNRMVKLGKNRWTRRSIQSCSNWRSVGLEALLYFLQEYYKRETANNTIVVDQLAGKILQYGQIVQVQQAALRVLIAM
jgi:hypothetical protein